MSDHFPFGVYDTKKCVLAHIGLYESAERCWEVFLGWPTAGEIAYAKEHGLMVLPITVSYDPPRISRPTAQSNVTER